MSLHYQRFATISVVRPIQCIQLGVWNQATLLMDRVANHRTRQQSPSFNPGCADNAPAGFLYVWGSPWAQADSRALKVTVLGLQLSRCISSSSSSASCHRPAFSHALMRLLYVITLRSHPRRTMSWNIRSASSICACPSRPNPLSAAEPFGILQLCSNYCRNPISTSVDILEKGTPYTTILYIQTFPDIKRLKPGM